MIPLTGKALAYLDQQSKATLLSITFVSVVLLGVIDYLTGFEISFALFYLFPVSLAAWYLGRNMGVVVSLASAANWHTANQLAGENLQHPLIPYWNAFVRLGFFLIVTSLVSEIRRLLEHEQRLSRTDFLTGALNRRAFFDAAATELLRMRRYGRPLTIAYLDLDNFKKVNDELGHNSGDELLQRVARTMRGALRGTDVVARLGGDEFALLLLETDTLVAQEIIHRTQGALMHEMVQEGWPVTFSIGVITFITAPPTVEELIGVTDQLMLSLKRKGKNAVRYSVYSE